MRATRRCFLGWSAITCLLIRSHELLSEEAVPEVAPEPLQAFPAYVDTLIPEDETPGGVALGVDRQIVATAKNDDKYRYLLSRGCRWLDEQARQHGADNFAALQLGDREAIVSAAEASPARSLAHVFFDATRDDALFFYYSNPNSWPGLGFKGPPQPAGDKEYARPPTERT